MTRILALALIALAVLLGGLAVALGHRPPPPTPAHRTLTAAASTYPVVVATRALAPGEPIPLDALRVEVMPSRPAGSYTNAQSLINRVPSVAIAPDAPVLEANLVNSVALELQPGERAVAVRVTEANAAGWHVHPGNVVDVFYTLRRGGEEIDHSESRLVVAKVRLLAYGAPSGPSRQRSDAGANGLTNVSNDESRAPLPSPRTAVLAVPVEDVDALVLAESAGQLTLALRNPQDPETVDARAFGPAKGVLKTVNNAPVEGVTQAARGLSLDQLAAGSAARAGLPAAVPPLPANAAGRMIVRSTGSGAVSHGVEVIRGAHIGTMAG